MLLPSILVHPCDKKNKGGCSHVCLKKEEEEEENGEGFICACPPGFELLPDDKTCKPVHPCKTKNKGGCSHICNVGDQDGVQCSCPEGFQLEEDGKTCEKGNILFGTSFHGIKSYLGLVLGGIAKFSSRPIVNQTKDKPGFAGLYAFLNFLY